MAQDSVMEEVNLAPKFELISLSKSEVDLCSVIEIGGYVNLLTGC